MFKDNARQKHIRFLIYTFALSENICLRTIVGSKCRTSYLHLSPKREKGVKTGSTCGYVYADRKGLRVRECVGVMFLLMSDAVWVRG